MKKRTIPYGYCMENGILLAHPTESETVQRIFRLRLEGWGVCAIGQQLFQEQVPFFDENRNNAVKKVSAILYKGIYCGAKNHPPLVDRQTFAAVQALKTPLPCVLAKSAAAASNPTRPPQPTAWEMHPTEHIAQLEETIRQCLQQPVTDVSAVRTMILQLAADKYNCIIPKETTV